MRSLIFFVSIIGVLYSCKPKDNPPCVPQKPSGEIVFKNWHYLFTSNTTFDYMECDTCLPNMSIEINATNYKSIVTRIGADPRNFGQNFKLTFPNFKGSYKVTTTLKNWGDCGTTDTLTTVIVKWLNIGGYSTFRLHGKRFVGVYDDGRVDTVSIDTVTAAIERQTGFIMGNYLVGFPKKGCQNIRGWNSGTSIEAAGNSLAFNNTGPASKAYCVITFGLGRFTDSTIYLTADTLSTNFSTGGHGKVTFTGRLIR